jgi:multicomponent Na+:H+ antiporter subunit C
VIGLAAIAVAALVGAGIYLLLDPSATRAAMGFLLASNGVNLLVLAASGMPEGARPPLIEGAPGPMPDPLAQAFILTAIVIGFGMGAFLLAMAIEIHRAGERADADEVP